MQIKQFLLVFLAITTCIIFTNCKGKKEHQIQALTVVAETAQSHATGSQKQYVGTVEESASTAISFTGSGTITRICVDEGQHVGRGQLIAELDKTQAQNLLSNAEAQLKQANDAYNRMKQLHDNNSLAEIKWIEIQTKLEQAQSQLQLAKKNLADCSVKAPVSGVIGKKYMDAGETALPSEPVCNILNIGDVKINVSIPEKEIGKIQAHTPTTIYVESIDKSFVGGTIEKGVQADALTHTYNIKINIANKDEKLLPGMVCNVGIDINETGKSDGEKYLSVPIRSVQRSADNKLFVWIVQGTKAHRQDITVGETIGNRIEVTGGLKENDIIIVAGYQKLSEGTEVKL